MSDATEDLVKFIRDTNEEISSLRAELSEWKAKAQALEIERNTLRAALQVISDSLGHPPFPVPTWRALSAAYAALRGKE